MGFNTETGFNTTLSQKLDAGVADATIILAALPTTITEGIMLIGSGTNKEWVYFATVNAGNVQITGCNRGLDKDATSNSDVTTANILSHRVGDPVRLVQHSFSQNNKADVDVDETITGDWDFEGIVDFDGEMNPPIYADDTARDAAITSPREGTIIKNTADGVNQQFIGGAWLDIDTGTVTPNGSTTVAGKYEEGTVAEQGTATATGSTGARLVPAVANLVKTSSGAGDENKIAILNASGQFASGFIPEIEPSESLTTGENVTAGDALRMKVDGTVYKATKYKEIGALYETNTSPDSAGQISVQIDTNKIAYVYHNGASIIAKVSTWDGDKSTSGSPVNVDAAGGASLNAGICKVDTNKFVVVQHDASDAGKGTAWVCTVSGVAITVGAAQVFDTGAQDATSQFACCSTGTDKVSIAWSDKVSSYAPRVITGTISGTTITFGSEVVVDTVAVNVNSIDIKDIGTDKIVVSYSDTTSDDLFARAGTIAGTVMTLGSETTIHAITLTGGFVKMAKVEDDKFVCRYYDSAGSTGYLTTCTVSTTTITVGTPQSLGSANQFGDVLYWEDGKVALFYTEDNSDLTAIQEARIAWVTFSGTVSTVSDIVIPDDSYLSTMSDSTVNNKDILLAKVNDEQIQFSPYQTTSFDTQVVHIYDNNFIGFAEDTITSGNPVQVNWIEDNNQTSLAVGSKYWLADSGALSTTGMRFAGTAISATKILKH